MLFLGKVPFIWRKLSKEKVGNTQALENRMPRHPQTAWSYSSQHHEMNTTSVSYPQMSISPWSNLLWTALRFRGMKMWWLLQSGTCLFWKVLKKPKGIPPTQASTAQHHSTYKTHITLQNKVLIPPVFQTQSATVQEIRDTFTNSKNNSSKHSPISRVSLPEALLRGLTPLAEQGRDN